MNKFDITIAKVFNYIKDCPEHQIVTFLESNAILTAPAFYNYWVQSMDFLLKCSQDKVCDSNYHKFNLFDNLKRIYGLSNLSGNSEQWAFDVEQIRKRYGLPIMLSCDAYYLPFSKQYQKNHLGTRLIVLDYDPANQRYLIGEAPYYIYDWVDQSLISFSHGAQQSARGYFHIPRLPEPTQLLLSPAELFAESINAARDSLYQIDELQEDTRLILWCEHMMDSDQLTFTLECFMHLIAGWTNLQHFLRWLSVNDSIFYEVNAVGDEAERLSLSWQRLQMDVVKLHRKRPLDAVELLVSRLRDLLNQESELKRMLVFKGYE